MCYFFSDEYELRQYQRTDDTSLSLHFSVNLFWSIRTPISYFVSPMFPILNTLSEGFIKTPIPWL